MTMDQWQRDIVSAREKVKKLEAARDALAEKCLALQQALDDQRMFSDGLYRAAQRVVEAASWTQDEFPGAHAVIALADSVQAFRIKCEQGIEPQTKGESL